MKLSKATWIITGLGITVIAAASLAFYYAQQGSEQSRLNQDLSLAGLRLENYSFEPLSSEKEELESQLAQARSQLEATKVSLSQSVESIEETDTLFDIAEDHDVEIIEIKSSFLRSETLGNITFSTLPLEVMVQGEVPNLIDFILKWTEQYPTGIATSVEITVPTTTNEEEQPDEEAEETVTEQPSGELSLLIYTYEDD